MPAGQAAERNDAGLGVTTAIVIAGATVAERVPQILIGRVPTDNVELAEGLTIGSPFDWLGFDVHGSGKVVVDCSGHDPSERVACTVVDMCRDGEQLYLDGAVMHLRRHDIVGAACRPSGDQYLHGSGKGIITFVSECSHACCVSV